MKWCQMDSLFRSSPAPKDRVTDASKLICHDRVTDYHVILMV